MRLARLFVVLVALFAGLVPAGGASAVAPPTTSCPVFPTDNAWHADISTLPVHARSGAWITSMGGPSRHLHPDFGPSGEAMPYGIPYTVTDSSPAKVPVSFQYDDESDPGPYPFGTDTPIEGSSDRHAIMVDRDTCYLYELYDADYASGGGSTAGSGAIWNLRSNALRPAGWTSADAAGLPIFAGLVRLDEVQGGVVDHAIRLTASHTDASYLWPARHQAGVNNPNYPPMGARFRLKASFDVSGFRADTRVMLTAMKRYGLIVADNGSDWYFTGTAENGWPTAMLDQLKTIPAGAFEAVDASSLMISPDSGQARSTTLWRWWRRPPLARSSSRHPSR